MKLSWLKLAWIAAVCVIKTMREGSKTHPDEEWKSVTVEKHGIHAMIHARTYRIYKHNNEDDIAHMITRGAMIKYLER